MIHRIRVGDQIKSLVAVIFFSLFPAMLFPSAVNAQEKAETTAAGYKNPNKKKHAGGTQIKLEEEMFPEIEFVASNDFRKASMIVPVYRGLNIEGYYFGIRSEPELEENGEHVTELPSHIINAGTIVGSYSFRFKEYFLLTPGFGVFFGEGQETSPAISFRWDIEKGKLVSQGLFILPLEESEEFGRVSIWDGNHVSLRLNRFEFGPTWERIHFREENEWKGGGRAAFRILPNLSVIFYVLAPQTEFRGGIIIHPERE
jgi:hypothetical protein